MPASSPFLMSLPRQIKLCARRSSRARAHVAARAAARAAHRRASGSGRAGAAAPHLGAARDGVHRRESRLARQAHHRAAAAHRAGRRRDACRSSTSRIASAASMQRATASMSGSGTGEIFVAAAPDQLARRVIDFLKERARDEFHRRAADLAVADRPQDRPHHGARHHDALGQLLGERQSRFLLAADHGAGRRAGICRGA